MFFRNRTIIILILFCVFCTPLMAQDTINWKKNIKLKCEDFASATDSNSYFSAISDITIEYTIRKLSNKSNDYDFQVLCYFTRSKSWMKNCDSVLLLHEQTHFDISEIFARKFKDEVNIAIRSKDFEIKEVEKIYNKIFDDLNQFTLKYDKETNHSKNKKAQTIWNNKVLKRLRSVN